MRDGWALIILGPRQGVRGRYQAQHHAMVCVLDSNFFILFSFQFLFWFYFLFLKTQSFLMNRGYASFFSVRKILSSFFHEKRRAWGWGKCYIIILGKSGSAFDCATRDRRMSKNWKNHFVQFIDSPLKENLWWFSSISIFGQPSCNGALLFFLEKALVKRIWELQGIRYYYLDTWLELRVKNTDMEINICWK